MKQIYFERIQVNKRLIGRRRKEPEVLTLRMFIGEDLISLKSEYDRIESNCFYNDCSTYLNMEQTEVDCVIEYSLFLPDYPYFVYSGLQYFEIRDNITRFRNWFESEDAKSRVDLFDKLSTRFWQPPPLYTPEIESISSRMGNINLNNSSGLIINTNN